MTLTALDVRTAWRTCLLAALFITCLFVPLAAAGPLDGQFEVTGGVVNEGNHEVEWLATGWVFTSIDGVGSMQMRLPIDATVEIYNLPLQVVQAAPDQESGQSVASYQELERWVAQEAHGFAQVYVDSAEAGEVRFIPNDGEAVVATSGGSMQIGPPGEGHRPERTSPWYGVERLGDLRIGLGGDYATATIGGPTSASTTGGILVASGGLGFSTGIEGWALGRSLNESRSAFDPVTGTGLLVYDNVFMVVRVDTADLTWRGLTWQLAAQRAQGSIDGLVRWTGVAGRVQVGSDFEAPEPDVLEVVGSLVVDADLRGSDSTWDVSGQASFVSVDRGRLVWTGVALVAAAGVAALLAKVGAALVRLGPGFLIGRAGRLVHADLVGNESRRAIMSTIHARQPTTAQEIERVTGLSRSTVRYHLGILSGHHVIQTHLDPRKERQRAYMLNSNSLMFALDVSSEERAEAAKRAREGDSSGGPSEPGRAGEALSVAGGHPVRRVLYEVLQERREADAKTLRAEVADRQGRAYSAATISHHLKLLREAGLIEVQGHSSTRVFRLKVDADATRVMQYRRFFDGLRLRAAMIRLYEAGGMSHTELRGHLEGTRVARKPGQAVRFLSGIAIIQQEGDKYALHPSIKAVMSRIEGVAS